MAKRRGNKKVRIPGQMKPYSQGFINTGKGPNIIALREYQERTRALGEEVPPSLSDSLERIATKQKAQSMREGRVGVEYWNSVEVLPQVRMFFNCDQYVFFHQETLKSGKILTKRSVTYHGRVIAMLALEKGVLWEKIEIKEQVT